MAMDTNSQFPLSPRGQQLLPHVVDNLAEVESSRILFSVPKTSDPADGFNDIDARTFARAVNRCCHWIVQQLGQGVNFPTITYMGPQDLVYGILILAAIKTGHKLLLISPRNTLEAQISLLDQLDCHTFLLPAEFPLPIVKQILETREMRVIETPGLQHWLEAGEETVFIYNKTFAAAKHDPAVVLHTSGSTGSPKPITQTHATWAPIDAQNGLPENGYDAVYPSTLRGDRAYMSFPMFHAAGVLLLLPAVIFCGYTAVLGPFPPSPEAVNSIHLHGNVQVSIMIPTLLIGLTRDPEHLQNLSRLKMIAFGGGPLPPAIGKIASTKMRLQSILGTTEAGILPIEDSSPEDWEYMKMSPLLGAEYRHVSGDLFEQVIVRNEQHNRYQAIFGTFPNLQEYKMKDLYSKHPSKPDLWLYRGRTDDIIVFATGEKLNPLTMEDAISGNYEVGAAIIAGTARFQPSLLVEPTKLSADAAQIQELLDSVWETVAKANKQAPAYAKIHRNMILLTSAEKPMLKAGKGTVQRQLTLDLYAEELDRLYFASESPEVIKVDGSHKAGEDVSSVKRVLFDIMGTELKSDDLNTNLFDLGLDSLQVLLVARELSMIAAKAKGQPVAPKDVYANPTIRGLTERLSGQVKARSPVDTPRPDYLKIESVYATLCKSLPISARDAAIKAERETVLITGTTGSLGSYVLDSLLNDSRVGSIYCLNRGPDSKVRQKKSHFTKGFSTSLEKVHFADVKYGEPYFGLPIPTYRQLLKGITIVIHNAWQVDFNLGIDSFEKHLRTVRQLVDFSANSRFGARLSFVSSIGSVANFSQITGDSTGVPEQVLNDWSVSQDAGYGQSKLIAERVLDAASRDAGVPVTICRLGQIAGPTTKEGIWSVQEWLPSLVASSKYLGKLPESFGQMDAIDWVPVDKAGQTIVELALGTTAVSSARSKPQYAEATVYHVVNPRQTRWAALTPCVSRSLAASTGGTINLVALEVWVDALRRSANNVDDAARNPAIKILEFFESLLSNESTPTVLRTDKSEQASPTLKSLGPVTGDSMENWLRQWGF